MKRTAARVEYPRALIISQRIRVGARTDGLHLAADDGGAHLRGVPSPQRHRQRLPRQRTLIHIDRPVPHLCRQGCWGQRLTGNPFPARQHLLQLALPAGVLLSAPYQATHLLRASSSSSAVWHIPQIGCMSLKL